MDDRKTNQTNRMSERFKALGNYVYEKGERIGVTPEESATNLARKLNAYQMRIERLKAENKRLRTAGDWMCGLLQFDFVTKEWNAAKEGKPTN